MPYIKKELRAGELHCKLTLLIIRYVKNNDLSYKTCDDIVDALETAKDAFQRNIQHPYEARMKLKK